MNEALRTVIVLFHERLGPDARGRVRLAENADGFIQHLVYRDGLLLYESGWPGKCQSVELLHASRKARVLAGGCIKELWVACGGTPPEEANPLIPPRSMKIERPLCLNCGQKPSVPDTNTLPLCKDCQVLSKGKNRGVTMTGPKRPKTAAQRGAGVNTAKS